MNNTLNINLCANPSCQLPLDGRNPKKKYCSINCKNQAAYAYKKEHYAYENKLFKGRLGNIQILEHLYHRGTRKTNDTVLRSMGFDFEAAIMPYRNEENLDVFRFGNLGLIQLEPKHYELVKF